MLALWWVHNKNNDKGPVIAFFVLPLAIIHYIVIDNNDTVVGQSYFKWILEFWIRPHIVWILL